MSGCIVPYVVMLYREGEDDSEVDDDDGHEGVARVEARSRTVTAMQSTAYRLHERIDDANSKLFLRWGRLYQVKCLLMHHLSERMCVVLACKQ